MPATCHLTPDAQLDLIAIRRHTVNEWGSRQSQKYLAELRSTLRLLAGTPRLGKGMPEIGQGVLSFPHVSHLVFYVMHERQVVVFGVLHKRMVPNSHLVGER